MAEEQKSSFTDIMDDIFLFVLAFLMLVIFLIVVFWLVRPGDTNNIDKVITGFIAWIGAIIGFYFGNKPVKGLRQQVEKVSTDYGQAITAMDTMKDSVDDIQRQAVFLRERHEQKQGDITDHVHALMKSIDNYNSLLKTLKK
jgi:hypothetical protein